MLLALLVLGLIGFNALLYPWIFTVGGKVRFLPLWQGVARVGGPGGTYRIAIWFSPSSQGSSVLPSTAIAGSGVICTPKGERYSLKITGGASGSVWRDMNGHEFHLYAVHRPFGYSLSGKDVSRPRLSFYGRWVGPDLAMNDRGALNHAFRADGSLDEGAIYGHSDANAVPVTFRETRWWPGSPCAP